MQDYLHFLKAGSIMLAMQTVKFSKGQVIFRTGDRVEHISLITEGTVVGISKGHTYTLERSDVLGLGDLKGGIYTYTFTAASDVVLCQYPCEGVDSLDLVVRENADIAYIMTTFMCRHIGDLLELRVRLQREIETVPTVIHDLFDEYCRLYKLYNVTKKELPSVPGIDSPPKDDGIPERTHDYYVEINGLGVEVRKAFFRGKPGIMSVFLHNCCNDIYVLYNTCMVYSGYLRLISKQLFNEDSSGLFSLVSQLHIGTIGNEGAVFAVEALMASLNDELAKLAEISAIDPVLYKDRLQAYWDALEDSYESPADAWDAGVAEDITGAAESDAGLEALVDADDVLFASAITDTQDLIDSAIMAATETETAAPDIPNAATIKSDDKNLALNPQLNNSLDTIIKYSGADKELAAVFADCVRQYTDLPDRNSPDDDVYDLRRDLIKSFYSIYRLVLRRTFEDSAPPTIINMFLNFGYVDGDLAGHDNANYLLEIADSFKGDPKRHIFTMREWLTSIFNGERDPSLSEFDMDYTEYIRDMKKNKQINPADEKMMLADKDAKLDYELDNAFPVVNRVTFGNPSKFCPVFSSHNFVRNLRDAIVMPSTIGDIIDEIRSIDFSAFYRETSYSDSKLGGVSEHINVEVLPNFILTPTIGTRGSMWQDIEGRVRTTPARIFLPTFLENDLKPLLIRLTGDFRWEICRRIQGTRWNDMTDPSLTSYFCDYLQFYMNNRSISMQTMTEIRNEISAARNNYKAVFLQNYLQWIQNESRGMARLNNISLGILMTFCPFSVDIRKRLDSNMRFREALNRYNVRQQKKVTHFSNLIKKLQQGSKQVPPEIKAELEFWYK